MKKLIVACLLALVPLCAQAQAVIVLGFDTPKWEKLSLLEREVVRQSCHPELPVARLVYYWTDGTTVRPVSGMIRCVPADGYFVVDIICYYRDGCAERGVAPQLAFDLEMRLRLQFLFETD